MQQYLFRGKRKDNGEWVTGCLVSTNPDEAFILIGVTGHIKRDDYEVYMVEVVPETVGMHLFTYDTNGKKVFDGDILNGRFRTGHGGKSIRKKMMNYSVKLHNKFPEFLIEMPKGYGDYRFCPHIEDSVIVGNIWDNPELVNPAVKDSVINTMKSAEVLDPGTQTAEGQQVEETASLESASQDNAMEVSAEEGGTEG